VHRERFGTACGFGFALLIAFAPIASAVDLTAGDVDDNLNFGYYQQWANETRGNGTALPSLDLQDRVTVRVVDANGNPFSNARVEIAIQGTDSPFFAGYAGSDGLLRFFPSFEGAAGASALRVTATLPEGGGEVVSASFALSELGSNRTVDLAFKDTAASPPTALDFMVVIDTTGSMADELAYLVKELASIVGAVQVEHAAVDIRYGLVVYRDTGDEYVVRTFDFTDSLATMQERIAAQSAAGGGDTPEAMEAGLEAALSAPWRAGNTARVALLVADAPPHEQNYAKTLSAFESARTAGIHIYSLAASGADTAAEYIMRAGAALTQGRYMFLTDDSGLGSSHAQPHILCYQVTTLSNLIARVIGSELAGKRIEAAPEAVNRTFGNISAGVCLDADAVSPGTPAIPTLPSGSRVEPYDLGRDGPSGSTSWLLSGSDAPRPSPDAMSPASPGTTAGGPSPWTAFGGAAAIVGLAAFVAVLAARTRRAMPLPGEPQRDSGEMAPVAPRQ
jgi:Spy/CpxP family protein refolding chaperone